MIVSEHSLPNFVITGAYSLIKVDNTWSLLLHFGGLYMQILGTFSGHRRVTRRLWTLTQIQAHFPGLLTHSNHVTTSIHSRKKHFPTIWGGGMAPLAPLATPLYMLPSVICFAKLSPYISMKSPSHVSLSSCNCLTCHE